MNVTQEIWKMFLSEKQIRMRRAASVLIALPVSLLILSGCAKDVDTSGSKPPQVVTQADYDKQIQTIQADPKMPKNVKDGLIARIKTQESGPTSAPAHP